jgi:hypothetical protein
LRTLARAACGGDLAVTVKARRRGVEKNKN